jgi:septal ring factor EnvC (AmiA/AmiB activator)
MLLTEVPTKRAVWRIALTAVVGTAAVIALVLGGYLMYHAKATEISNLKQQRQALSATNGTLSAENETLDGQLASARTNLRKTDAKLTKTTEKLEATKKDLREMKGDLAVANERADANYSVGHDAGVNDASDQLFCSDDPDAGLPACSFWP